jgi:hypothetical protein
MSKQITHIRFPNESYYDEITTFKLEDFQVQQVFECEAFGIWKDTLVSVMIEDYNALKILEQVKN